MHPPARVAHSLSPLWSGRSVCHPSMPAAVSSGMLFSNYGPPIAPCERSVFSLDYDAQYTAAADRPRRVLTLVTNARACTCLTVGESPPHARPPSARCHSANALFHLHRYCSCRSVRRVISTRSEDDTQKWTAACLASHDVYIREVHVDPKYGPLKPNQRQDYRGE